MFDGSLPEPSANDRIIDSMLAYFGPNGERWIKGQNHDGARRCLGYALQVAASDASAYIILHNRIVRLIGTDIPSWNDCPRRTFAEVRALLAKVRDRKPAAPVSVEIMTSVPTLKKFFAFA